MSTSLPFLNSTGLIAKILDKIIEAQTPDRYTQDFQSTVLGYGSGSARPFIPLLKRIGFLNSDGSPTELYKEFRNENNRDAAMLKAIKTGYAPLYKSNEYAHKLPKDKLRNHVIQVTGFNKDSSSITGIVGTFEALKSYIKSDTSVIQKSQNDNEETTEPGLSTETRVPTSSPLPVASSNRGMNLSYTINLNLPSSKDPEVFNAIFKSLKENLLS